MTFSCSFHSPIAQEDTLEIFSLASIRARVGTRVGLISHLVSHFAKKTLLERRLFSPTLPLPLVLALVAFPLQCKELLVLLRLPIIFLVRQSWAYCRIRSLNMEIFSVNCFPSFSRLHPSFAWFSWYPTDRLLSDNSRVQNGDTAYHSKVVWPTFVGSYMEYQARYLQSLNR